MKDESDETTASASEGTDATLGKDAAASGAGSKASSDSSETDEDIARRRRKNRVNAKRSRERKRVVLDTLQQEHWQLHQDNKRLKTENEKLRDTIESVKKARTSQQSLQRPTPRTGLLGLLSSPTAGAPAVAQPHRPAVAAPTSSGTMAAAAAAVTASTIPSTSNANAVSHFSNPLVEILAQRLLLQESVARQQQQQQQQTSLPQHTLFKMANGATATATAIHPSAILNSPAAFKAAQGAGAGAGANSFLLDLAYQARLAHLLQGAGATAGAVAAAHNGIPSFHFPSSGQVQN